MNLFEFLTAGLPNWFGSKAAEILNADYRDDPVYKQNLQRLIERNREFEEKRNEPNS
jgi:hypothetical protein